MEITYQGYIGQFDNGTAFIQNNGDIVTWADGRTDSFPIGQRCVLHEVFNIGDVTGRYNVIKSWLVSC